MELYMLVGLRLLAAFFGRIPMLMLTSGCILIIKANMENQSKIAGSRSCDPCLEVPYEHDSVVSDRDTAKALIYYLF